MAKLDCHAWFIGKVKKNLNPKVKLAIEQKRSYIQLQTLKILNKSI